MALEGEHTHTYLPNHLPLNLGSISTLYSSKMRNKVEFTKTEYHQLSITIFLGVYRSSLLR